MSKGKPRTKSEETAAAPETPVAPAPAPEVPRPTILATAVPTTTVPAPTPASVHIDGLGDLKRTHTCGELSSMDAGRNTVLMGWVHRVRDH
ncbi:MAG TPA: hypothetical protein VGR66_09620, partial [Candidatus Eisenbacteria bacterium]|nr:hypothetical protein [Candidatus Eisenbacteria bacterium]